MASKEDEERWRAEMKKLGLSVIKMRLADRESAGPGRGSLVRNICAHPEPLRSFVEDWVIEEERSVEGREKTRFRWMVLLTAVAAVAAVIAAWPIVKSWLQSR